MKTILFSLFLTFGLFSITPASPSPYVLILGTAQDAGAPQIGCQSPFCQKAWKNPKLRQMVSSLALIAPDEKKRWIFDATPDLPAQFQLLKETTQDFSDNLDGIFLTHAHIGHYTGLMYLGREALNTKEIKVYAMPRMKSMLETNAPWSQLVNIKNILLEPLENEKSVQLTRSIKVEPFLVPHRDEFSETVGFKITSGIKTLIFIPDIDKWQKWNRSLEETVKSSDYVFIDGTFYQDGEINRPISEVPHPFVSETAELLKNLPREQKAKVYFIHFNNTNPLIQGDKRKIREIREKGFNLAFQGQKIEM